MLSTSSGTIFTPAILSNGWFFDQFSNSRDFYLQILCRYFAGSLFEITFRITIRVPTICKIFFLKRVFLFITYLKNQPNSIIKQYQMVSAAVRSWLLCDALWRDWLIKCSYETWLMVHSVLALKSFVAIARIFEKLYQYLNFCLFWNDNFTFILFVHESLFDCSF